MDLSFWQKARFAQPMSDALDDAMADWHEVHQLEAPRTMLLEEARSSGPFLGRFAQIGGVGQFRCHCGRDAQSALTEPRMDGAMASITTSRPFA